MRCHLCNYFARQRTDFGGHSRRGVRKFCSLRLHGLKHALVAMTDVDTHRHRVEIKIAFVVYIPEIHALGALHGDRVDPGLRRPGVKNMLFGKGKNLFVGEIEHESSIQTLEVFFQIITLPVFKICDKLAPAINLGTLYVPFRSRQTHGLNRNNSMERRNILMRNYELVCIFQPELDETAFKGAIERVSSWVTEAGGSVDKVEIW